jgi:hypothetical protein
MLGNGLLNFLWHFLADYTSHNSHIKTLNTLRQMYSCLSFHLTASYLCPYGSKHEISVGEPQVVVDRWQIAKAAQ